jgi:hypothetical protein
MEKLSESCGQINSFRPGTSAPVDSEASGGRKSLRVSAPAKSSWRTRAGTHKENLLAILRARGASGVLSSELYAEPSRFGRSPRNRCCELRQEGHRIETIFVSRDMVRYVLEETAGQRRAAVVADKCTTELPLFDSVTR